MEILCRVTAQGLVPMYDSDYEEKKQLSVGETVLCTIKKPRNYEFHKKFFALVRLTLDNLPEQMVSALGIYNEADMLNCLKLDLGLYDVFRYGSRQLIKPRSISFAAMDETEFHKFYDRCVDIILQTYLRGTDRHSLLEEIERFK